MTMRLWIRAAPDSHEATTRPNGPTHSLHHGATTTARLGGSWDTVQVKAKV